MHQLLIQRYCSTLDNCSLYICCLRADKDFQTPFQSFNALLHLKEGLSVIAIKLALSTIQETNEEPE